MTRSFARRIIVASLLTVALWGGGTGAAVAADPTPADTESSDLTVTVPPVAPRPGSNNPPPNVPPAQNPPANTGGSNTGGSNTGGSNTGGAGRGGGGSNAGPAAPAADPGPPTEPDIADEPAEVSERATVDRELYQPGDQLTVTMGGFTPGEQVQIVLYSEPVLIGNVPAGNDGVLTHSFALPDEIAAGTHTVQLTGWQSKRVGTVEIFVASPTAAAIADSAQGVPFWVWWVAGGLGALLLVGGAWWIIRAMRAPGAVGATA